MQISFSNSPVVVHPADPKLAQASVLFLVDSLRRTCFHDGWAFESPSPNPLIFRFVYTSKVSCN